MIYSICQVFKDAQVWSVPDIPTADPEVVINPQQHCGRMVEDCRSLSGEEKRESMPDSGEGSIV